MLHKVYGPQFVSGFWKNWTPAFIVCLIFQNQTSWSDHLTSLECAYNTILTTVTGMSPFHCAYRYQLPRFQESDGDKVLPWWDAATRPRPGLGRSSSWAWYRWRWQLTGIDTVWHVKLGSVCQPVIFLFMCTLKTGSKVCGSFPHSQDNKPCIGQMPQVSQGTSKFSHY